MSTRFERGAPDAETVIPLSVPEISGHEWQYVQECLNSNWVSSAGPFVDSFEQMTAEAVGARYAVATASGTAALHTALLVAGVGQDEEVLMPALTFIAPANAVRYVGAWPVFMDVEPNHWQMDPEKVAAFLQHECRPNNGILYNKSSGRRIRALLPVHILGHPVNMEPILEIARQYDLIVIEDAAESIGAKYQNRSVGNLGDIACFSFNGNKILTTGGGGMVVTNREDWAVRAKYLTTQAKDDPVEYVHQEIGYNYRLTNIQAAIGCAQMERLNEFVGAKRRIAARYSQALATLPGVIPMREAEWAFSTFWLYTILVAPAQFGVDSRQLLAALTESGIQTRPLWQPLHRSPAHREAQSYRVEVADQLYQQGLSLPCSVGLTAEAQQRVIRAIGMARAAQR